MAKRNLSLLRKTTREPEIVEEPEQTEPQGDDYVPVEYDAFDDAPPDFTKPLSASEAKRLSELEGLIKDKLAAFLSVGYAMREIRDRQLYRTTHRCFSDYIKEVGEMARGTAYRFIDAVDVVDMVRGFGQIQNVSHGRQIEWIPQNERQARALIKYKDDPKTLQTVVTEAVKTAPDGKITAAHIKKTARQLHLEKVRDTVAKAKRQANQAPRISEDFRKAFNDFLDAVNIERANEYKHTDRDEVIRHVRMILEALEAEL
jgi:hypothetical protein